MEIIMLLTADDELVKTTEHAIAGISPRPSMIRFNDGYAALAYLKTVFGKKSGQRSAQKLPILVLAEMDMPVMDGYDYLMSYNAYFGPSNKFIPTYMFATPGLRLMSGMEQIYKGFKGYVSPQLGTPELAEMMQANQKPADQIVKKGFFLW